MNSDEVINPPDPDDEDPNPPDSDNDDSTVKANKLTDPDDYEYEEDSPGKQFTTINSDFDPSKLWELKKLKERMKNKAD